MFNMSRVLFRCALNITGFLKVSEIIPQKLFYFNKMGFHVHNLCYQSDINVPMVTFFDKAEDKSKQNYLQVLNAYKVRETHRRGHVEFIYGALKYMKEFGVEKDLEVYRALVDVMPKGKFVPQNLLQAEFMHYPKQQQCIIDVLSKMEYYRVIPDPQFGEMLINIFGHRGYPVRKFMRMLYWMPKFKNISPWPIPEKLSKDAFELAMLAIKRITSVDPTTDISVFSTRLVEDAVDDTWIISAQSEDQKDLLKKHKDNKPVYIEGGLRVWLREASVFYFVLRGDAEPAPKKEEVDLDDVTKIKFSFFTPPVSDVARVPSVHEQEDGVYYAVCATGTSSRDSLLSWIRLLQKENPRLLDVPVLFKLRSPSTDIVKVDENNSDNKTSKEVNKT